MYKIEDSEDLSPLIGLSVQTAMVEENSLLIRLGDGTEIQIEHAVGIDDDVFRVPFQTVPDIRQAVEAKMIGQAVVMVYILSDTDVSLVLGNSSTIVMYGDNAHYECFSISGPQIDLIV